MKNIRESDGSATVWQKFYMKCTHEWNGNCVNLLNVAWKKNHCLQVNVFSAGFSHLQPLLDGFSLRVTLPNHGICWLLCVANTNNKPIKIPAGLRCRVPAIAAPTPSHRRAIAGHSNVTRPGSLCNGDGMAWSWKRNMQIFRYFRYSHKLIR